MSLFVKICGITDPSAAAAAVGAGADALGFVFAPSVRRVSPQLARQISDPYRGQVATVAVFLAPSISEIDEVLAGFTPDFVQADQSSLEGFDGVAVLPVVRDGEQPTSEPGSRVLFEGRSSGVGETANWNEARRLADSYDLILAGGLNPTNVADAIRRVNPGGVDVSSGVESDPGEKSPRLIEEFIDQTRRAEREMVKR